MNYLKYTIPIMFMLGITATAQEKLNLQQCYNLTNSNYPLTKQKTLLAEQNTLDLAVIKTEKMPKLDFSAQASYQSAVTAVPLELPNVSIEPPNKDQYKATISANQMLYDGGIVNSKLKIKETELKVNQQQVEIALYQLKKQINSLYFSILLLDEKKALILIKKEQLEAKLKEVSAAVKYGVALPASDAILKAELLKVAQNEFDIDANKKTLLQNLSQLIGQEIKENTVLERPHILVTGTDEINRPELNLFELQNELLTNSSELIAKKKTPKVMAFATGGYGNPGLNMLDNSFQEFYMVGVKLNWNILDWKSTKKQQKSLAFSKQIIDNKKEVFEFNTNVARNNDLLNIKKLEQLLKTDIEIIPIREEILKTSSSQLKNGVITSSAYITELSNLHEAKNSLKTHEIQLLLAKANYQITSGTKQ